MFSFLSVLSPCSNHSLCILEYLTNLPTCLSSPPDPSCFTNRILHFQWPPGVLHQVRIFQTQLKTLRSAKSDYSNFLLAQSPRRMATISSVPINALVPFLKCSLTVSPNSTPNLHHTSTTKCNLPRPSESREISSSSKVITLIVRIPMYFLLYLLLLLTPCACQILWLWKGEPCSIPLVQTYHTHAVLHAAAQ